MRQKRCVSLACIYMYMRGGWLVVGRAGRAVFIIAACMHACMHACMRACMCRGAEIAHSLGALISPTTFTTTGTAAVMACAGWMDGADVCRTRESRWRGEAADRGEGGPGCDKQGASRGPAYICIYLAAGWWSGRPAGAVSIIAACMHACVRACMCRGAEVAHSLGTLI